MGLSLGNLAVAGARAFGGLARGKVAGQQLGVQLEDRNRRLSEDALRLSLAQRADRRAEKSATDLETWRADERNYRDALLKRRDTGTDRQAQSDEYARARAIADYQAGTNARAWKPETLAVYLKARFPKLEQDRLLGIAQQSLAKSGGLIHLNLDEAAENIPE